MHSYKYLTDPHVISSLQNGGVGIIPTDTVYGIVCCAKNEPSTARLYKLKGRSGKPGTIVAANIDQLESLGLKRRYLKAVEEYWPGPVSILIPCSSVVNSLDLGTHYLAARIPDDKNFIELLNKVGPLLTSSANKTGSAPVINLDEARAAFKDNLDFYVDGGDYSKREASAVIRIVDDAIEILRPGYRFKS